MGDFQTQQANASHSQGLAAAIQRAKQIAAKIQPNQQPGGVGGISGGGGGGGGGGSGGAPSTNNFKRSHDDNSGGPGGKRSFGSPEYSHNNNSNMSSGSGGGGSDGGGGSGANITQAMAQAAAVAARLAATAGTTCEEQVRVPESIVNAFIGRSGNDTITHLQAESGCKVQLMQDQERVITLRGSRESVTKGREMLQQLVTRNGGGGTVEILLTINMPPPGPSGYPPYQEIMIPGAQVGLVIGKCGDTIKQLQQKTGAKMMIIQDKPNQELIKPLRISGDAQKIEHAKQMVLDLIAQKDAQSQQGGRTGGNGGGSGGGFNNFNNGSNGGESVEVFVPKIAVGVVIGKGGDMIRKIQMECGCKLQFIQGKNDEMGDRRCLIQGTQQQVEDAKRTIDGLIENVMQRNGLNRNGSGSTPGGSQADNSNSNYGYGYGVNHAQGGREEITFLVPASKCGIVIGRGGETIKLINQQSGAHTEMDRNATNPPNEKLFKSKGTADQVEAARQMIAEKINMELAVLSRKNIGGGGGGGGGGSNNTQHNQQGGYGGPSQMQGGDPNSSAAAAAAAYQQHQPWGPYGQQGGWDPAAAQHQQMAMAAGQGGAAGASTTANQDYSAQWIEYYKQLGCHREAEMIEQQMKAKQGGGAASHVQQQPQQHPQQQQPQQPQPQQVQQQSAAAAGGGTDYSAQWAEYYRSVGKIEEAEAIEKQLKSKQPNGGNNNAASASQGGPNAANQNAAAAAVAGNYVQSLTASQYAQYSQYYAVAAAAGQQQQVQPPQPGGAPNGPPAGYPGAYPGGYGGYPGVPPNNQQPPKSHKGDKH